MLLWQAEFTGAQILFEFCPSAWLRLTASWEEKVILDQTTLWSNTVKISTHLDKLVSCLFSAAEAVQSRGSGGLKLVLSFSELSSMTGQCGKKGALTVFPPCIHFGLVTVFEVVLSCRKLRGRLRVVCMFAMPVCTKMVTIDKAKYYITAWQWHKCHSPIKRGHLFFWKGMAMSGTAFKTPYAVWAAALNSFSLAFETS